MADEVTKAILEASPELERDIIEDEVFSLSELERSINEEGQNDPNELLKRRFLCKGHITMIAAQTGCGKSSLIMQMIFCFALGRDCFGLQPVRPLKTLLIQGENDRRDLYEEMQGIQRGLSYHALITWPELERAKDNITVRTCTKYSGEAFLEYLETILSEARNQFDLLVIDPLFSYAGCDLSKEQGKVSEFLRNGINTIIRAQRVGCIFVHHMNKPAKTELPNRNYNSTYDYAGSGEIANLMRAVIVLERLKDDESKIFYRLIAPKRGGRIEPDYCRYLAWATDGGIYWQEIEPPKQSEDTREAREEERKKQRADKFTELAKEAAQLLKPGEVIPKKEFRERFAGALKITGNRDKDVIMSFCIGQGFILEREKQPGEKFGRGVSKLVELPAEQKTNYPHDEESS